jgi:hypothetical protein
MGTVRTTRREGASRGEQAEREEGGRSGADQHGRTLQQCEGRSGVIAGTRKKTRTARAKRARKPWESAAVLQGPQKWG